MAGFGQTVEAQKKLKDEVSEPVEVKKPLSGDPFAEMRAEDKARTYMMKTHQFIGIMGHDGTCKSAIVLDAFEKDESKPEDSTLQVIDFDGGGGMLNSSIYKNENIRSWNPWQMGHDRTAHDYPATHDRIMKIMRYLISEAEAGKPVWGVLLSGIDSWLEICNHNMRIVDLGMAKDAIQSADYSGGGMEKIKSQTAWGMRNARFHQLTRLSRDRGRLGVRVFWETHMTIANFSYKSGPVDEWKPAWEKKMNGYLPTIIHMQETQEHNDEGELEKTVFTASYTKCKTNPNLVNQSRTVFVTRPDGDYTWNGLPDLYDGTL